MRIPNLNTETARFPGDWKHLSLFSGSGIGDLAARAAGIETVAQCECDTACCYCLERLWPEARLFRDVRDVTAAALADLGQIDIISGGFPCVDISTAGKGAGLGTEEEPTRSGLWFEFARVIRETRPRWVLIENVPALRVRGGDRVCSDLEAMAYEWEAVVVGAWAVGAPHKRDRVWIVAHRRSDRLGSREQRQQPVNGSQRPLPRNEPAGGRDVLADGIGIGCERRQGNATGRNGDGTPTGRRQGDDYATGQDLAGGLADSDRPRLPLPVCERSDPREEQPSIIRSRWPARPGEPQHAWEAPRLVEFGVGGQAYGLARRIHERLDGSGNGISPDRAASRANKTLLKMCGNSWVYPLAVLMFRAIRELDREML